MLTKFTNPLLNPINGLLPVHIVLGEDLFLTNQCLKYICSAWQKKYEEKPARKIIYLADSADWSLLEAEIAHYSLFAEEQILDIRYEKKTLDAEGKKFLENYLQTPALNRLLFLRAPYLTSKSMQSFANHSQLHLITLAAIQKNIALQWIQTELKNLTFRFDKEVPALIYQYNENNLLACAQVIEKLDLLFSKGEILTATIIEQHLVQQSEYSIYELSDACLKAQITKIPILLQQFHNNKIEASLVLWLLSQEIRLLLQMHEQLSKHIPFQQVCANLKIWSSRSSIYQMAYPRCSVPLLERLLLLCEKIDRGIKLGQAGKVWQAFESLALSIALGKQVGSL